MSLYATTADELAAGAVRHIVTARVVTRDRMVPLVVSGGETSFDEQRAPWALARLECHAPARLDLAALDPRALPRVEIRAGYVRPDGRTETHRLARLDLRDRDLSPRGLELLATGQETRITDAHTSDPAPLAITAGTRAGAIRELLSSADAGTDATAWRDTSGAAGTAALDPADRPDTADRWDAADALANLAGLDVYDAGGVWVLEPRRQLAAAADYAVTAGHNLVDYSDAITRATGWANAVRIVYEWTETGTAGERIDHRVIGSARTTSGPFASTPRRVLTFRRPGPITQASADAAALEVLTRAMGRGRAIRVTTPAPYWLRPGHTLAVALTEDEPSTLHLIGRVRFDHARHTAELETRAADESATETGE